MCDKKVPEMPKSVAPKSAILYQNQTKTIFLIDIPTSISLAQGTSDSPHTRILRSSPPLQSPYASTEPKSEATKAKVRNTMGSVQSDFPTVLLLDALKQIKNDHLGDWCLPRKLIPPASTQTIRKHKFCQSKTSDGAASVEEPDLKVPRIQYRKGQEIEPQSPLEMFTMPPYSTAMMLDIQSISHQLVRNIRSTSIALHISLISQTCIIPPHASFMLAKVDEVSFCSFSHAAREVYPTSSSSAGPGQFDFILLDPPWDNRSVQRSRKYSTLRQHRDPMEILHDKLGPHIAPGSLVACWITNRPSVRNAVMKAFENWNVDLIEEWVWLKTTVHGEPVLDLDGLWRKPYEILLLGRETSADAYKSKRTVYRENNILRKVLVAVPDLHSRKPNLKELVGAMMLNAIDVRALEVFARNLTAGWWSWGDEVLKFSWEGHWSKGS